MPDSVYERMKKAAADAIKRTKEEPEEAQKTRRADKGKHGDEPEEAPYYNNHWDFAMSKPTSMQAAPPKADFEAEDVKTPEVPNGIGRHDGQWELAGARQAIDAAEPSAQKAGKAVGGILPGTPKSRGEALHAAIEKVRALQAPVDKGARAAWGIPMYGKILEKMGAHKPEAPVEEPPAYVPSAQEQEQANITAQIDAIKYANEQARIDDLRKKLLSGN